MTRRTVWLGWMLVMVALAVEATVKPNIILVLTDDMGVECLGAYGESRYKTPVLDRMAVEGVRFDHAHSNPLCTPTRVELMTGRDNWEGGHRVPFVVSWPKGFKKGVRSDQLVCQTDIFATMADLIGDTLADNEAEDSFSFLHALTGTGEDWPVRENIIHHTAGNKYAFRQGDWVFIDHKTGAHNRHEPESWRKTFNVQPHSEPAELFNLKTDPHETVNAYTTNPEIAKRLKAQLEKQKAAGHSRSVMNAGEK